MDAFKPRAKGLSDGLEAELSVVVDVGSRWGISPTRPWRRFKRNSRQAVQAECRSAGCRLQR